MANNLWFVFPGFRKGDRLRRMGAAGAGAYEEEGGGWGRGVEWRVATAQNKVFPQRNISISTKWFLC